MPFFAAAHMYAFSYRDFIQPPSSMPQKGSPLMYAARMRLGYAFRDAFGLKDLVEDSRATLGGKGINYRAFEPSEGGMHIGAARERRIRAGLRYSAGGKRKYWLPDVRGLGESAGSGENDIGAPLLAEEAEDVVHHAEDLRYEHSAPARLPGDDARTPDDDEYALRFSDALAGPNGADEMLYEHAKKYVFGDYLYPVVDVSSEEARRMMWEQEARVVRESIPAVSERNENKPAPNGGGGIGYGATRNTQRVRAKYETVGESRPERIVDFEQGDAATLPGGMRLGWTNVGIKSSITSNLPSSSGLQNTSSGSRAHTGVLSPAGSKSVSHLRPPPLNHSSSHASHSSSSSRFSRSKSTRTPLAEDDAIDLIIPASDSHHMPPSSPSSRASYSPHPRPLIRVWDQSSGPVRAEGPLVDREETDDHLPIQETENELNLHKDADVPEVNQPEDIIRLQTTPSYTRDQDHRLRDPFEDEDNPWA
ncbi:hypothetical protein ID866_9876 [Astraeus odoratus]|nr:hypothetical protein ID866_9876 [Astraeus odoratus]